MIARNLTPVVAVLALAACGAPEPTPTAPPVQTQQAAVGPLASSVIESATVTQPSAAITPTASPGKATATPDLPEAGLVRAQILLARARFSPGAIDGLAGSNMKQAVAAFETAQGLPSDGILDEQTFARLIQVSPGPVTADYVTTQADIAGPYVGTVPTDLEAQEALSAMGYGTIVEALAERFQVTEALLRAMNPAADFNRVGQRLTVPSVSRSPLPQPVDRIVIDKTEDSLKAFAADGTLLAYYPATIGSSDNPTPSGTVKVNGVARNPEYVFDPKKLSYGEATRRIVVQPGPNNPVGVVWIDLNRPSYGIHGTPEPHLVGKTASHGCVRLTNWDAMELAAAVKPGVTVRFV